MGFLPDCCQDLRVAYRRPFDLAQLPCWFMCAGTITVPAHVRWHNSPAGTSNVPAQLIRHDYRAATSVAAQNWSQHIRASQLHVLAPEKCKHNCASSRMFIEFLCTIG